MTVMRSTTRRGSDRSLLLLWHFRDVLFKDERDMNRQVCCLETPGEH